MEPSRPYVTWARLAFADGTDPRAAGAAVTLELCGAIEHEPPCRWPHNNDVAGDVFRTLFAAPPVDESEVRRRIEDALRRSDAWEVLEIGTRDVLPDEGELAARLGSLPRRQ